MDASRGFDCIYVSPSTGVHDVRWVSSLTSLGHTPRHIPRDSFPSDDEFIDQVATAASGGVSVITGPLDVALMLQESVEALIFLSWGFDLQEAAPDTDLSGFRGVIVDSHANEDIAQSFGAQRTALIPWGIDLASITSDHRVADLTEFGVSADEKVVLSLRAHEEIYRVGDIIEAFAQVPIDARLVIGNSGSLTPELRQLASKLEVDAVFLPPVAESDVPALLRRANVYVTASRVDGTSVTLLQAMACGVPVVASANVGNLEWIEDGSTGFLFPIADVDALGSAMHRGIDEGPRVTRAAQELVAQRADWRQNIRKLNALLTTPA